jgi:hypothetical protein
MVHHIYDQIYIKECFNAWYLNGRPTAPKDILAVIPVYGPTGGKPTGFMLKKWMIDGFWDVQADEMDAKAMILVDDALVNKKAEMLRRHQKDAETLAEKALSYLKTDGFDSSSAAVQAYFRATEEQRKTAGFSDLLEKLDKMSNNDVENEIISKFNRIKENDQIIELETEGIGEEDDTE